MTPPIPSPTTPAISLKTEPLIAAAFAPFGDVLEAVGTPDLLINNGKCARYHNRAQLDFASGGKAGLSLFKAETHTLPYRLKMLERHPHGAQAFIPMQAVPFLVIVAPDEAGRPGRPRAFLATSGQGVSYHRGVWHGVLAPLSSLSSLPETALFGVVDWIGDMDNLEEHWLDPQYVVETATY